LLLLLDRVLAYACLLSGSLPSIKSGLPSLLVPTYFLIRLVFEASILRLRVTFLAATVSLLGCLKQVRGVNFPYVILPTKEIGEGVASLTDELTYSVFMLYWPIGNKETF